MHAHACRCAHNSLHACTRKTLCAHNSARKHMMRAKLLRASTSLHACSHLLCMHAVIISACMHAVIKLHRLAVTIMYALYTCMLCRQHFNLYRMGPLSRRNTFYFYSKTAERFIKSRLSFKNILKL